MPHILQAFDNAAASGAWPGLAQQASGPNMQAVRDLLSDWDFSTPTGIIEGYDPGDPPLSAPIAPSAGKP